MAAVSKFIGYCVLGVFISIHQALADADYDTARKLREAGDILPLETILHKLNQTHPGKVLQVELEHEPGRVIYEIELLDAGGKVWEFKIDPRNGEILKQKEEH